MPEKKNKFSIGLPLKNLALLPSYFNYILVHLKTKNTSQARIKPKIFGHFRPEPGPNPTRKALPDLKLCASGYNLSWL